MTLRRHRIKKVVFVIMKLTDCVGKNKKKYKINSKNKKKGYGVIDYIINKLPEVHVPTYQYCGPGTDLETRLNRGDPGINKLDTACKQHDISYSKVNDSKERYKADKALTKQAFKRIFAKDSKLSERATAALVSGLMTAKMGLSKIGFGLGSRRRRGNRRRKTRKYGGTIRKRRTTNRRRTRRTRQSRILNIPKFGGIVRGARGSGFYLRPYNHHRRN